MTTTRADALRLRDAILDMTIRYGDSLFDCASAACVDDAKFFRSRRAYLRRYRAIVRLTRALANLAAPPD